MVPGIAVSLFAKTAKFDDLLTEAKAIPGDKRMRMMFTTLKLSNFTVFKTLNIDFSPGINIFVGANGTGKTHLLKLLYCILDTGSHHGPKKFMGHFQEKLSSVFRPDRGDTSRLARHGSSDNKSTITIGWKGIEALSRVNIEIGHESVFDLVGVQDIPFQDKTPVYIPVKEPLSFAQGFISLYDQFEMAFDEVYYDILKRAYLPRRKVLKKEYLDILDIIFKVIGGEVVIKSDTFYLRQGDFDMEISLVAEGFRKLALIWRLIRNGSIKKGTTLFWDEPEASLNPFMMRHVAQVLILLANQDIQVFVATHNYAFLKELDHQKEQTPVTYFSLNASGENGVTANACSEYVNLSPNKIADEYLRIYDMEIDKAFKRGH